MKKLFVCLGLLFLSVSCSINIESRNITVSIPLHQWEKESSVNLWYTLKWTAGNDIKSLRVNSNERDIAISIPYGETVYICAYPMDRLNPIGSMICPSDNSSSYVLDSNSGVFCGYLIDQDRKITGSVNTEKLKKQALKLTSDFRDIDYVTLMKDILNGELKDSSLKVRKKTDVGPLAIPDGYWIAENRNDQSFYTEDGLSPSLSLPVGTWCWYCQDRDIELVIIVNSDGDTSYSTRMSNIG